MPMLRKTMGLALAGLLMMAPISMAAGPGGTSGAGQTTPGAAGTQPGTQPGMGAQQPGTQPGMGAMQHQGFQATVEQIDREERKLHLRTAEGDKMEVKVPQQVLTGLQQGDRVQVAIEKAPSAQGTSPGASPGASPGGTGARPGQPGQSGQPGQTR